MTRCDTAYLTFKKYGLPLIPVPCEPLPLTKTEAGREARETYLSAWQEIKKFKAPKFLWQSATSI